MRKPLVYLALYLMPFSAMAQTATPISGLPAATTPLTGTEVVPVVQGGATKKATVASIQQSGTQTANTVLAAPNGSAGAPTFRALAPADHAAGAAIAAGNVVSWNSDVGLSRTAAGNLAVGNGTAGDISGALDMAQLCIQANVNLTQISSGNAQLGSGCTAGQNANLFLNSVGVNTIQWNNAYPLSMTTANSTAMYWSVPATAAPTNPYYDNLAIGEHTLNATTHNVPAHCTSVAFPFANFCGDEVAFGDYTLSTDTQGHDNTALGDHALANLTTGVQNTVVGSSALPNYNGSNSTAVGVSACQNVTNSVNPLTCIGLSALQNAGTSSGNVIAIGTQTMIDTTTATSDVAVGDGAGYNSTSTTSSVLLGTNACSNGTTVTNSICIGVGGPATGTYSNMLWIGGGTNPPIQGNLSTNALTFPGSVTIGGGLLAGGVLGWNSDTGFSRTNSATAALGNGTQSDATGTLVLAGLNFQYNANFSQITTGQVQLGTGSTIGHGGSLYLTNLTAYGFVREGQTTFANLSTIDPTPQVGDHLVITDASACTANTAVTAGGGSAHSCAVVYNGANWVALVTH